MLQHQGAVAKMETARSARACSRASLRDVCTRLTARRRSTRRTRRAGLRLRAKARLLLSRPPHELDDIVQRINVGRVIKGDKYGRHHFRPPVRGLPNYNSAGLGGPGGRDASV